MDKKIRILIVDEGVVPPLNTEYLLRNAGFGFETVYNAQVAINRLALSFETESKFDLTILIRHDCNSPNLEMFRSAINSKSLGKLLCLDRRAEGMGLSTNPEENIFFCSPEMLLDSIQRILAETSSSI